jgi:hypothetical protein
VRVHCKRMRKERANSAERERPSAGFETGRRPQGRGQSLLDLNRPGDCRGILVHCGVEAFVLASAFMGEPSYRYGPIQLRQYCSRSQRLTYATRMSAAVRAALSKAEAMRIPQAVPDLTFAAGIKLNE